MGRENNFRFFIVSPPDPRMPRLLLPFEYFLGYSVIEGSLGKHP